MLTKNYFPAVTIEERRFLRNFATTDQIVEWAQQYADKAIAAHERKVLEDVEPVAWRFRWSPQGDWLITSHEPRGGDGINKEPLYSASTVAALKAERDAALARVAVLEKDAVRYRWLRQEHERFDPICHLTWKAGGNRNSSEWVNTAVLDSSIDAALTKGQT